MGNARHLVSWRAYERAMFNELYYVYRPPRWRVTPDLRTLRGLLSHECRQIDVAVFAVDSSQLEVAVECKRYGRRLNVKDVEAFLAMLDDLGAKRGVLVTPVGFSAAAQRRVQNSVLTLLQLPEMDALCLTWRELARAVFPWDEDFHPEMGNVFHALMVDEDIDRCIAELEELPFEEWEGAIGALFRLKPIQATSMLNTIAQFHPDDGWRYNALRLLNEFGVLTDVQIEHLLEIETDGETIELLHQLKG